MMRDGTHLTAKEHAEFLNTIAVGQMVQVGSYTANPLSWGPVFTFGVVTDVRERWIYVQGMPFDRVNGFAVPPDVVWALEMGEPVRNFPVCEHFIEPLERLQ